MNAAATATRINLSLLLLIVGLPLLIGLCIAQYFLGRAKNSFLGWIFPIMSLLIGLIVSLSGLTFQEPIGEILLWCLIPQIPTVIDLLLLGIARNVRKQSLCHTVQASPEEMRRMNIQDL
jgi:hypothetical protein